MGETTAGALMLRPWSAGVNQSWFNAGLTVTELAKIKTAIPAEIEAGALANLQRRGTRCLCRQHRAGAARRRGDLRRLVQRRREQSPMGRYVR